MPRYADSDIDTVATLCRRYVDDARERARSARIQENHERVQNRAFLPR